MNWIAASVSFAICQGGSVSAQDDAPQQQRGTPQPAGIYRHMVDPRWFDGDSKFWYRNTLKGRTKEFILVDCEKGERKLAFDHAKLAAALAKSSATKVEADRLPFDEIEFSDGGKAVLFAASGKNWKYAIAQNKCESTTTAVKSAPKSDPQAGRIRRGARGFFDGLREATSPDGKWTGIIKEGNIHLRSTDGKTVFQLSKEGTAEVPFGMLRWSPDSKTVVASRTESGDRKQVHLLESSPKGGGRAVLKSRPYPLPGDKFDSHELWALDVAAKSGRKLNVEKIDFGRPNIRWSKDGKRFTYEKVDRGHQRFRLIEVDLEKNASRNLIDEQTKTFIWTAHTENIGIPIVSWLSKSNEILYSSERSGWRRLHLFDAETGKEKNIITPEGSVLRGVDQIDEDKRQLWFRACGLEPNQDPYFIHAYRIDFDGKNLVRLTDGDGSHAITYSPSRKWIVDRYSRVDKPPVNNLRSGKTGKLICRLENADVGDLNARGFTPLEPFVAKGRDGKTDIWGVVQKPKGFDPTKKYPVIESIYAGPQGSFVPKVFSPFNRFATLTDLGFVVVQIDGMGTANRSKAFHDACWHDIKDAGFPDRILWHKAFAAKNPWYDVSRVGIYGTSAGGQNAMGAVLFHGDFYKAACASCGCHDNRMDKASWNEQWMGYPVGPHFAASSNVDNAHRLKGNLLLIVGEMDDNVPPESTYRVVDALVKANKEFEFLMIPGMGHSNGGAYGTRRMQDFFKRSLMSSPKTTGTGEQSAAAR